MVINMVVVSGIFPIETFDALSVNFIESCYTVVEVNTKVLFGRWY